MVDRYRNLNLLDWFVIVDRFLCFGYASAMTLFFDYQHFIHWIDLISHFGIRITSHNTAGNSQHEITHQCLLKMK